MATNGASVRLCWWNEEPNFGDALAPLLVSRFLGRDAELCSAGQAELVVTGSILQILPADFHGIIVGAGFIDGFSARCFPNAHLLSVRGPLSAELVGGTESVGDPGILAADFLTGERQPAADFGVVPHYADTDLIRGFPHHEVVDVRQDPISVIRDISRFGAIVTSSLHGLIVADALGVERTWAPHRSVVGDGFKFHDYAASIGLPIEPWRPAMPSWRRIESLKEQVRDVLGQARSLLERG